MSHRTALFRTASAVAIALLTSLSAHAAIVFSEDFDPVGPNGTGTGNTVLGDYNTRILSGTLFGAAGASGQAGSNMMFHQVNLTNSAATVTATGVSALSGADYLVSYDIYGRNSTQTYTGAATVSLYASTDTLAGFSEGSATLIASHVAINPPAGGTNFQANSFSGTSGVVSGNLFLVFSSGVAGSNLFQQPRFDNLTVAQVPEQSTIALFGLGIALTCLAVRHRRRG